MLDGPQYTAAFEAPGGQPVLAVYPDPLSGGEPLTVGLGHTGPDVHQGDVWTADRCWSAFYNDYAIAQTAAAQVIGTSCWASLSVPRQAVLTDMAFNIGEARLTGFHNMLAAIRAHDWEAAQDQLLASAYAKQVKTRAKTNAAVLLTGKWPEDQAVA